MLVERRRLRDQSEESQAAGDRTSERDGQHGVGIGGLERGKNRLLLEKVVLETRRCVEDSFTQRGANIAAMLKSRPPVTKMASQRSKTGPQPGGPRRKRSVPSPALWMHLLSPCLPEVGFKSCVISISKGVDV
ncbi:uncharacterized protein LOC144820228 [Lissotriton helveticus]